MSNVRVFTPDQLDFSTLIALQHTAFAEVIRGTGTDYLFCEPYYRWKYDAPEGTGRTALVSEDGEVVAANSMFPLRVTGTGGSVRAWQSCDTATHPRARGRGYFLKCLGALREQQRSDEIFFGFPNKNSTPGLLKFGWNLHGNVDACLRILPGGRTDGHRGVAPVLEFGVAQDEFARALGGVGGTLIERSAAYMNWRYCRHPLHRYDCFAWTEAGQQVGLLVMRRIELSGRVLAVALELLALEPAVEHQLLSFAASWAREQRISYTLVLNNTLPRWRALAHAYVPIPRRILPKQQVLCGASNGGRTADLLWREPWSVQIGDWDVF